MRRLLLLSLLLPACAPDAAPPDVVAAAPALDGKADGGDAADRGCQVVLRDVIGPAQDGYQVDCSTGACFFTWTASVDVAQAQLDGGATPAVLYHLAWDPTWYEVASGTRIAGADAGYQRFSFKLFDHLIVAGDAATPLDRARVELIPLLHTGAGRLFDHNRRPGDLDSYLLDGSNQWSLADDAAACHATRPNGTVSFLAGWTQAQHGPIVAGGTLTVEYDLARLPGCMGSTYNGLPAWDTLAYVRFLPGGQLTTASVKGSVDAQGSWRSRPLVVDVPTGATSVELWFYTSGEYCTAAYDSNYGANYRFPVEQAAPAPVAWAGDWGNGFQRDCTHYDGLSEPVVMTDWMRDRACLFVDADVYVPGLTDAGGRPEDIAAQVEYRKDGGAVETAWLTYVGQVGHDARFRWMLPRPELSTSTWSTVAWDFRFSTDGARWFRVAQGGGPDGGAPRTIQRGW